MNYIRKTILVAVIGATASIATVSDSSASTKYGAVHGASGSYTSQSYIASRNVNSAGYQHTILDGSTTASFFYKRGIKNYEKGDLEKAEQAFKASLRAKGLDLLSVHYLAVINQEMGNEETARKYVNAYNDLNKR